MSTTETESADADTDEEQLAWANQTPTTRVKGTPKAIIYTGRLDDTAEQNDPSFGVVFDGVDVVVGDCWENQSRDGETTAESTADDEPRPTDFRIADADDSAVTVTEVGDTEVLMTDEEGPNTYETGGDSDESVIIWYNGLAGQRIARTLDFNGSPFARWTDDGYLIKGLFQPAEGWRDANGSERGKMAKSGKAPRVARFPILRNRVDYETDGDGNVTDATLLEEPKDTEVLIDISRAQSGRGYRAHVFDAEQFVEEVGSVDAEMPRTEGGYVEDIDAKLEMPYSTQADTVLEQAEYSMEMYTGEGWQNEPDGWTPTSTSGVGSFGVSADSGGDDEDDDDTISAEQEQFISEVVDEVAGSGMTPDEMFDGGLEGLIGKFSDSFTRTPEPSDIRSEVYARVSHLDPDELEA